ncbi:hypothetical protein JXB12_09470, partial [candidate division KSB1 bacterium]|nr:hypothetical protein [candidate division KSB1 bacterium]
MSTRKSIDMQTLTFESSKIFMISMLIVLIVLSGGFLNAAYAQDLTFSDPFLISTDTTMISTMAASALDVNGKLHIVFVGWYYEEGAPDNVASEIFYTNNMSGVFVEPVKLPEAELPFSASFEDDFYYSKEPSIAVDANGTVHVAYYRTETQLNGIGWICSTNNKNGDFSVPKMIFYDPCRTDSRYYSLGNNIMLAAGVNDNKIHIVFDGSSGTGHGGARYAVGVDGNFTVPTTYARESGEPTIKLDCEGVPYVLYWIKSDTTEFGSNVNLALSKIENGHFSIPVILFESDSWVMGENAFAIDQYDSTHIVFRYSPGGAGATQMHYIKGIDQQYTTAMQLPTNTCVSLMYAVDVGKDQTEYIAYKQAAGYQSLGFMYNDGSAFIDVSPTDYIKHGITSAGPQWFTLDNENNIAYFVYTTGYIYLVTVDLNDLQVQCALGDVNNDGSITPGDALCAFQTYLNGGTPPAGTECDNECALYAADVNCTPNGITPGDALYIFQ